MAKKPAPALPKEGSVWRKKACQERLVICFFIVIITPFCLSNSWDVADCVAGLHIPFLFQHYFLYLYTLPGVRAGIRHCPYCSTQDASPLQENFVIFASFNS
jgi:hypothetical protein